MLQNVFRGLCRSGGVVLVAGAIGVLTSVEHLMSRRTGEQPRTKRSQKRSAGASMRTDRFTIRRTTSELGYTYWVLQGHGKFRGFTLFDTWREAIDEVDRRVGASGTEHELALPSALVV